MNRPSHLPARLLRHPVAMAAACLAASGAMAQQAAPRAAVPASAASASSDGLQEVVITAEFRRSSVQNTAASVTAISGEDIREKGQTTLASVLSDTPAVEVQASPQGGQIYIRGVGANGDSNWVDPAVALNLDGVYSGRAERVLSSMYDVDRVEILRGPQGTLYGRNATGGSVNVITNDPDQALAGGLNAQVGNYNLRHLDGFANVPVNDVLAFRVALMREKRDGYFTNNGEASDLTAGRLKVLLKPTRDFSLLATVDSFYSDGTGMTTVPRAFSGGPAFFNWTTDYSNPWRVDPLHPADTQRTRFNTYSLQAQLDLGFGVLSVLPSYTHNTRYVETSLITGIAVPGDTLPLPASTWEEGQKTLEVRLSSEASSPIIWVVGAYDFSSNNVQTGTPPSYPPPTFETPGTRVPTRSKAIFGQATVPLTDTLRLTGGLRYTEDSKTYNYEVVSTSSSTVVGYDSGPLSVSDRYHALTYKAGAEYDLAKHSLLYAQVATGYKAGGFSTTATPPLAYAPEKLTAFELGSKNRFLDNTLQINGEAYYYLYKDFQAQYADSAAPSPVPGDTATAFQQYVVNAGRGKNRGVELESRYRILPETTLIVSGTYAHARYGDFSTAALAYLNGTKVAMTPAWTTTLGAEQSWMLGGGTITVGGEIKFSDGYMVTLQSGLPGGDLNNNQSSFHKTDLHVSYYSANDKWNATLWLKNLENKAQTVDEQPFGRTQITPPRTFGLNVAYKF
jgi:iron complex outermembrane receptor protein